MQSRHLRTPAPSHLLTACALWLLSLLVLAPLEAQRGGQASPAAQRPPQTTTPQQYPREQVEAGRVRFAAQCGFCHGRDAAGGEGGTDLTRSALVAGDVRGNRIIPLVRSGRTDKGMPAFTLSDADLAAIVAFIHDQKTQAESASGGRRVVEASDLQSGNAEAGRRYFEGACVKCHSASGDLSGIASRFQGLALLQRMLNPGAGRGGGSARAGPKVTVKTASGEAVSGTLTYRDEFTIAITDTSGWHRSWPTRLVTFTVDDPLQAHVEQLGKYTDADMHDVLAYLQTLK
jgi:cytochrome c oxidase cbb3-type subunit 3